MDYDPAEQLSSRCSPRRRRRPLATRFPGRPTQDDALIESSGGDLGLIPMAIAGGANTPLARAVIGGVLASTVLTLFVVPVLHSFSKQRSSAPDSTPDV